jgi:PadR family transcriptional regulator PadR
MSWAAVSVSRCAARSRPVVPYSLQTYVIFIYDADVHRRHRWRSRNRRRLPDGSFDVRARVERFGEPAVLCLLAERPTHGYELLERLPALLGEERVDVGNVYRALRALEEDGLVVSEWQAGLPGPAKRTYTLTDDGREALRAWLASLAGLRDALTDFLDDSAKGGEHVP